MLKGGRMRKKYFIFMNVFFSFFIYASATIHRSKSILETTLLQCEHNDIKNEHTKRSCHDKCCENCKSFFKEKNIQNPKLNRDYKLILKKNKRTKCCCISE